LLVLLGDLIFMGPCILSIFQCIANKMQRYTIYLYLETALYVSGGISTHHQERIRLYLQHLVFVTPLLLSAAIVEKLEPVWVCCGWRTPPTAPSDQFQLWGHVVAQLVEALRYSRKVAGSITDGVIGILHWHNPSGRIMTLGSTQPLTEMSTRNISWRVKAAGAYGWQPYHLRVPIVLKSGSLNLLEPSGPVQDCNGIALPF